MKKIIYNITAVLLLGLLITSCEDWDEYKSADLAGAPDITLNLVSVLDSAVMVSVNTNVAGYVSVLITEDTSLTVDDIDAEQLLVGNQSGLEQELISVENAGLVEYTFTTDLIQNHWYQVFAVATNEDGVFSLVEGQRVMTDDTYAPVLVSTTPTKSAEAAQDNLFSVAITFSEPVQVVDTSMFHFSYYYGDETIDVQALEVSESGNVVTVYQDPDNVPYNGEWVFLSWEEGAVTDFQSGTPNKVEAKVSGVIDGFLEGLYWRVQHVPFDIVTDNFMPEVGSAVSDPQMDIMYKFPYPVSFTTDNEGAPVYENGDINVSFWTEGKQTILDIPADYLTLTGGDSILVISLPEAAQYGNDVSVNIAEGVVEDIYGNPNAAFESDNESGANWLISYGYTRDMIIGTYTVDGVSHPALGYNESFDVTIAEDPENENQVLVTGLYYSDTIIVGVFNGDFATLTFNMPFNDDYGFNMVDIGDIFDDGVTNSIEVYGDDHFVCHIDADGNMFTDDEYWWASYYYGSSETEGWNNIFVASTWTKTESVLASVGEKSARITNKVIHNDLPHNGVRK
ncbi:MAG TPA: hypothetical protein VEP89_01420 [Draconibacterium sp.]|nr:hypothetical protein [Draconibacterium sp.]